MLLPAGPTAWLAESAGNAQSQHGISGIEVAVITAEVMSLGVVLAESSPQTFIAALGSNMLDQQTLMTEEEQQQLVVSPHA